MIQIKGTKLNQLAWFKQSSTGSSGVWAPVSCVYSFAEDVTNGTTDGDDADDADEPADRVGVDAGVTSGRLDQGCS